MRTDGETAVQVARAPSRAGRGLPAQLGALSRDRAGLALAALGALVVVGVVLRVLVARQSVFADELSTYWIVTTNGLGDVWSVVHSDAEITPPLSFVAGWLATQIDTSGEALRLPSLVAGAITIPVVYLIGVRAAGRATGVLAAALTTFSPFMIYYSAEARGYALMMAAVALSTLCMLMAVDERRTRWWVAYGLFSCAAVYTHYTCVFVLAAQLLWLVWTHPEARRPALMANLGAVVLYLPWVSGFVNDMRSPTTDILSDLQPFDAHNIRLSLEHWSVGYLYASRVGLRDLPGVPALVMLALAALVTLAGLVATRARGLATGVREGDRRVLLLFTLALATPVGAGLFSAIGSTAVFGTRNLAASWPGLALAAAVLIAAAGPRLRFAAAALAVGAMAIAGVKMLNDRYERPQYEAAGDYVEATARPGDVVVDETAVLSPGPLSHIDPVFDADLPVIRSLRPAETDHPFTPLDRPVSRAEAARKAEAAANGRRIFVVTDDRNALKPFPMGPYRMVRSRSFTGFVGLVVQVYAKPGDAGG
jgi:4-amino-4-deoxy-L-arabinose transferase-like glycosyltransferase